VLDYDDLLLYWAQTMSDPVLADDIGGRFDHVLVDEYQDTKPASVVDPSRAQNPVATALPSWAMMHSRSIHSALRPVRNILDFPGQFSPPASIITLDRNYRSTQTILAARQWRD